MRIPRLESFRQVIGRHKGEVVPFQPCLSPSSSNIIDCDRAMTDVGNRHLQTLFRFPDWLTEQSRLRYTELGVNFENCLVTADLESTSN